MNTYRTHTKLSAALRSLAQVRDELRSQRVSVAEKLILLVRWFYFNLRVRLLIDRLHSR